MMIAVASVHGAWREIDLKLCGVGTGTCWAPQTVGLEVRCSYAARQV